MFSKLDPPLSLETQIPAEPLELERFQEAMDHPYCMFGRLNLGTVTTGCPSPSSHTKGHARPEPFLYHRKTLPCLLQDPVTQTTLCVKARWQQASSGSSTQNNSRISTGSLVMTSSTGQPQQSQCHLRAADHISQKHCLQAHLCVCTTAQGTPTSTVTIR